MIFLFTFLGELYLLFLLSKNLLNRIYHFFYRLTKNQKASVYFLALVFLPGTFIHEVSHLLMSLLMFVRFGRLELIPEIQKEGVKLGSLPIQKVDLFRRTLIGAAPFLFGVIVILTSVNVVFKNAFHNPFANLILIYIIFVVGNTMFSSKKDLEGSRTLVLSVIVIFASLYILGLRLPPIRIETLFTPEITSLLEKACLYLLPPLAIDVILLAFLAVSV